MTLDYIAVCPECGHAVFWMSGELPTREIAQDVGRAIRAGLSIERCSTDDARKRPWRHKPDCSLAPRRGEKQEAAP